MSLRVVPLTLAQANELIGRLHRHHKPVQGHRFSIGVENGEPIEHDRPNIHRRTGGREGEGWKG